MDNVSSAHVTVKALRICKTSRQGSH